MIGAKFTFLCDPVDYSNDPKALRVSTVNIVLFVLCVHMIASTVSSSMLALLFLKIHRVFRHYILYPT